MNKFNLVALLHKSQLKLFILNPTKAVEEVSIDFPEDTVKKSDIFDHVKFSFDVKNQLIKRPELRGSTILFLLPAELVFSRVVGLKDSSLEGEKRNFFAESPTTAEESHFVVYGKGKEAQLLSIPKKLIVDIENSFSKIGFKVVFLPLSQLISIGVGAKEKNLVVYELDGHYNFLQVDKKAFPILTELDLDKEKESGITDEIKKIAEKINDLKAVILFEDLDFIKTFLKENNIRFGLAPLREDFFHTLIKIANSHRREISRYLFGTEVEKSRQGLRVPWRFLGLFSLLFLLAVVLIPVFLIFKTFGERQNVSTVKTILVSSSSAQLTATPEAQITASPSAQLALGKEDLKMKILNGNRIPGDAARLQSRLTALGFTNSDTDTADKQGNHDTSIKLSSRVTPTIKAELQKAVEQDYVTVVFASNPSAVLDIEILTGARN